MNPALRRVRIPGRRASLQLQSLTNVPFTLTLAAAGLAVTVGCSDPPDPRRTNFQVQGDHASVKYDPGTGKLARIDVDQDKNGRIDTFSYWDGARLIRIELDRDEDGKVDRWEYYDDHKKLNRIGSSSRDDEIVDTWSYPDDRGLLARVETDTDRDGTIDKRETFEARAGAADGRVLRLVEIGINQAGIPERRLHYRPDGSLERTERGSATR